MSPGTATRRRVVRRLVASEQVSSQHQLVELLAGEGHLVTQATVSRDLEAIGAVKERVSGSPRYVIPDEAPDWDEAKRATARAITEFVESITTSGNLVVVHTPPGAAHLVAGAIDHAAFDGVLGTVAGDDTLLIVAAEELGGEALASELERIGAGR